MTTATVQFYDVAVFFHVTAMVLAFGPTFAYGLFFATAAQNSPAALPSIGTSVLILEPRGRPAGGAMTKCRPSRASNGLSGRSPGSW